MIFIQQDDILSGFREGEERIKKAWRLNIHGGMYVSVERETIEEALARIVALREVWDNWRGSRSGGYTRSDDTRLDDELLRLFKSLRRAMQSAFHLKPGFTYEEFILHVTRSHSIPLHVKEKLVMIGELLNVVEYADAGSYEDVSKILDLTVESLEELANHLPKGKRRKKRRRARRNPLLIVTFLIWGPFVLAVKTIRDMLFMRAVRKDPRVLIRHLLDEGREAMDAGDLPRGVHVYEALRKEYATLPEAVQRAVRPEIIEYYNALLDMYEEAAGKHIREEIAQDMVEAKSIRHEKEETGYREREEKGKNVDTPSPSEEEKKSEEKQDTKKKREKKKRESKKESGGRRVKNVSPLREEEKNSSSEPGVIRVGKASLDELLDG